VNPNDATWRDKARRWYANHIAQAQYYDSEDPNRFSAGPVFTSQPGLTELDAGRTITGRSVYQPDLQFNTGDEIHGRYGGGTFTEQGVRPRERPDYTRPDDFLGNRRATLFSSACAGPKTSMTISTAFPV